MPGTLSPLDLSGIIIPHHFRCPISLELMHDPVTISTGQTFDRPSIESWVSSGHSTCPVTRSPLTDFTLIPNHTLRRLIQHWCVAHRSLGVERIPTPKQPADPSLINSLLLSISSPSPTIHLPALRRLAELARESDKNRALIASSDELRSTLIDITFNGYFTDKYADSSIEAMAVLSMIPLSESDSTAVTSRKERLAMLGDVVTRHQSIEVRIDAAAVIEAVASAARSPEARVAVGETDGVIEGLVWLVMNGNGRGVRVGIRGLFSLCLAKENRGPIVAAGAAVAVVRRIGEVGGGDAERALAMIELICRTESGRKAVVEGWGGGPPAVAALVRSMAGKSSERAAEHAAGALVAVVGGAEAEEELQRVAVAAGVVPQLLVMVQGGCSERAKRKAQLLLKLLRSAWPRYGSMANSDDFVQAY